MRSQLIIAALQRCLASSITSDELKEFMGIADSYDDWYEDAREEAINTLKDEIEGWEDLEEYDQDQHISETVKEMENSEDSTMIMFRDPKPLPKGTWVVHRTRAEDPVSILDDLNGCGPTNIGLTFHYGCSDGDLMFALGLDETDPTEASDYGKHGILFQVGEAVLVEHIADIDSMQVVFDNTKILKAYPYIDVGDSLTFWNKDGELLASLKKDKNTYKKFVKNHKKYESNEIPF